MSEIAIVTTPHLLGYEIVKVLSVAYGLNVRTGGLGGDIVAAVEEVFGGEVTAYISECEKARKESLNTLVENAKKDECERRCRR